MSEQASHDAFDPSALYGELRKIARRMNRCGSLSPTDIVHETLAKILERVAEGRELDILRHDERKLLAYLRVCMQNVDRDRWRGRRARDNSLSKLRIYLHEDRLEGAVPGEGDDLELLDGLVAALAVDSPRVAKAAYYHYVVGLDLRQTLVQINHDLATSGARTVAMATLRRDLEEFKDWLLARLVPEAEIIEATLLTLTPDMVPGGNVERARDVVRRCYVLGQTRKVASESLDVEERIVREALASFDRALMLADKRRDRLASKIAP